MISKIPIWLQSIKNVLFSDLTCNVQDNYKINKLSEPYNLAKKFIA